MSWLSYALIVAGALSFLYIAACFVAHEIALYRRVHGAELPEPKSWLSDVPPNFQTPEGKTRVGIDQEAA